MLIPSETERAGEGIAVGSRAHLQDEAVAQVCVLLWLCCAHQEACVVTRMPNSDLRCGLF